MVSFRGMIPLHLRRQHRPVYREILAHAFRAAWREKRYWPLAIFASLLLSAGSYDVLLNAVDAIGSQATRFGASAVSSLNLQSAMAGTNSVFVWMAGLQASIAVALVFLAFVILSIISQGGLVYALGAVKRGKRPTLGEAFRVGGGAFWPVAALNAVILSTLWILRFLIAFPLYLAIEQTTPGTWFLYFLSFLVFMALSFVVTLIHIFALNAMILQGAPVAVAIVRGYETFKRHWVVSVETALLLFIVAVATTSTAIVAFFFCSVPLIAALIAATASGSMAIFATVLGVGLALLLLALLSVASFLTQLQYATWTFLYRRIGEGGTLPKIHRWVRNLFGVTAVPQR